MLLIVIQFYPLTPIIVRNQLNFLSKILRLLGKIFEGFSINIEQKNSSLYIYPYIPIYIYRCIYILREFRIKWLRLQIYEFRWNHTKIERIYIERSFRRSTIVPDLFIQNPFDILLSIRQIFFQKSPNKIEIVPYLRYAFYHNFPFLFNFKSCFSLTI